MHVRRLLSGVCLAAALTVSLPLAAQPIDPASYADMRWRLVGPFRGGWATCAAGVPDDPAVYYFGAAAGGVWKTEDAGSTWAPLFDRAGSASVGALAIAPSDPKVIYVGTGQIQARYDIASGDGVYRSSDGGKTWTHVGLAATRAIGRILVDPRDANVAVVAALGHMFGPNRERGIYRTEDGGKTWNQVLFVDDGTGGADLAADPENPAILYASLWQARNFPWLSYFRPMVGPTSAIYKSLDGGRTWKRLGGKGWPAGDIGRIGLAAAPGGRVYALVDAERPVRGKESPAGGLYRSDDGGASWARVNATPGLASSYMNRVTVDPAQARRRLRHRPVDPPLDGRRQDAAILQGRSGRRRLPLPLDQPEEPRAHGHGRRPGHRRVVERGQELEQLVQPADRPVLPRRNRRPLSVLDLQRAAGQRHRRRRDAQRLREPDLPRLASGRRRGARLGRARSAGPAHRVRHGPRRHDHAVRLAHGPGAQRLAVRREHVRPRVRLRAASAGHGASRSRSRRRPRTRSTRARSSCCARPTRARAGRRRAPT